MPYRPPHKVYCSTVTKSSNCTHDARKKTDDKVAGYLCMVGTHTVQWVDDAS